MKRKQPEHPMAFIKRVESKVKSAWEEGNQKDLREGIKEFVCYLLEALFEDEARIMQAKVKRMRSVRSLKEVLQIIRQGTLDELRNHLLDAEGQDAKSEVLTRGWQKFFQAAQAMAPDKS